MDYSQVIYFDRDTTFQIVELQNEIRNMTGSSACLEIREPHLTIGNGINVDAESLLEYEAEIKGILKYFSEFSVQVKGIDFMDDWVGGSLPGHTPYVIYLSLVYSDQLIALAEKIRGLKGAYPIWYRQSWPYRPHITLAYKDLTREGYELAKKNLTKKEFLLTLEINHVALAAQGMDGKRTELRRYGFGNNQT